MTDQFTMTVDEFMTMIEPELERQVDEWIDRHPLEDRPLLRRQRSMLLYHSYTQTRIANLEHRLRCAEASSRPTDAQVH